MSELKRLHEAFYAADDTRTSLISILWNVGLTDRDPQTLSSRGHGCQVVKV